MLVAVATKIETSSPEFQKELVYFMCPRPSTTTKNTGKLN